MNSIDRMVFSFRGGNYGLALIFLILQLAFTSNLRQKMEKRVIMSSQAPAPIGPYSQAIGVNGMVFVSGQIAIEPSSGKLITEDIIAETHQVMKNLQAILKEEGLDFRNVVKTTIFVKDLSNFGTINQVYGEYFSAEPPARETVEVSRLPKDVNVEISCIAVKL